MWGAQGRRGVEKTKPDVGAHVVLAKKNAATVEVHSNGPIPVHVKEWLDLKSISCEGALIMGSQASVDIEFSERHDRDMLGLFAVLVGWQVLLRRLCI